LQRICYERRGVKLLAQALAGRSASCEGEAEYLEGMLIAEGGRARSWMEGWDLSAKALNWSGGGARGERGALATCWTRKFVL